MIGSFPKLRGCWARKTSLLAGELPLIYSSRLWPTPCTCSCRMFARVQLDTGPETPGQPVRKPVAQTALPFLSSLLTLDHPAPTSKAAEAPPALLGPSFLASVGSALPGKPESAPSSHSTAHASRASSQVDSTSGARKNSRATTIEVDGGATCSLPATKSRDGKHSLDLGAAPAPSDLAGRSPAEAEAAAPPNAPEDRTPVQQAGHPALEGIVVAPPVAQSASHDTFHSAGLQTEEIETRSAVAGQSSEGLALRATDQPSGLSTQAIAVGSGKRPTPLHVLPAGVDANGETSAAKLQESKAASTSAATVSHDAPNRPTLSTGLPGGTKAANASLPEPVAERMPLQVPADASASISSLHPEQEGATAASPSLGSSNPAAREVSVPRDLQSGSPSSIAAVSGSNATVVQDSDKPTRSRGGAGSDPSRSVSMSATSSPSTELSGIPTPSSGGSSAVPLTGSQKAKVPVPQANSGQPAATATSISEVPLSHPATGLTDLSKSRHAMPETNASFADGSELENQAGFAEIRTLVSTPHVLEVGVAAGAHGWLRVRAELGASGEVAASLQPSSAVQEHALGEELGAISDYLSASTSAATHVSIARHDGPSAGVYSGISGETTSFSGGEEKGQQGQAPVRSTAVFRKQEDEGSLAIPTGSWGIAAQSVGPSSLSSLSVRV